MVRITCDAAGKVFIGLLEIGRGRQAEKDGERSVLAAMLGYVPVIEHNEDGKPVIADYHVSISHTVGYVAVALSRDYEVGIDIEYVSERVRRIAPRFLRHDEMFTETIHFLIAWCAKETMYKLFSSEHLALHDMKVDPFSRSVTNLKQDLTIKFECEQTAKYVLTYAWHEKS